VTMWGGLGVAVGSRRVKNKRNIGELPKFWDLQTMFMDGDEKSNDDSQIEGWDGIMPISVTIKTDTNPTSARTIPMKTTLPYLQTSFDRPSDDSYVSSQPDHVKKVVDMDYSPEPRIQVAVAIAMPANHLEGPDIRNTFDDNDDDRQGPVVYNLGLYEGPWRCEDG